MKIRHYTLALVTTVALSTFTFAGTSAKDAIATLRKAEGASVADHIVGLTGRFGQDQPQEWEILARRGAEFAMFIVDANAIQSFSKVRPKAPVKLATKSMKLDSTSAFRIADKAAKTASVGFDSLSYDLKPRTDSAAPVWIIDLADSQGATVGRVHIAADSGKVLLSNWDREQLNSRSSIARSAPSTGATRGILADRRGTSTQTGTTADGLREGLASLRNVFRKGQVSKTDQSKGPKTSNTRPN